VNPVTEFGIVRANASHTAEVARLFDLYRQFYECDADIDLATAFVRARIENSESVIFLAESGRQALGFVQLYPSFCSVDAIPILILYDLYVGASARRSGVGEALMRRAGEYARKKGVGRVDLLTAMDNYAGQQLYEKLGYERSNENFYSYSLDVGV
jgi:ribosomal protein S18 acetylase RimI-like enzyme